MELSERFSFRPFYDFLLQKKQQDELKKIAEQMKKECAKSEHKIFDNEWGTMPLKYNILKGNDSFRRMGLIQPFSALNIYLFMECFQKDILNFFEANHRFSIRYHRKSNDLYYKTRSSKTTRYVQNFSRKLGKSVLQQTGSYFKIYPFDSVNSFTASRNWRMCNYEYTHFAKIDYKSCFDSTYSHVFTWIIERNVVDSKNANNSSLFLTIDRMLMNINGKASNGIIVGPEYMAKRRMVQYNLIKNAASAYFAAIEIHNKPNITYRYETVTLLLMNAWELALKAYIKKNMRGKRSIFEKSDHTISFDKALDYVTEHINANKAKSFMAIKENLIAIEEYRNNVAHFYCEDLQPCIFTLVSRCALNFVEFLRTHFNRDIIHNALCSELSL